MLKEVAQNPHAETIMLDGFDFTDPWYWRFTRWDSGMSTDYKKLLVEKHDPHLRFPHLAILKVGIETGLVDVETIEVDTAGRLKIDLSPAEIMGMNTHGALVSEMLRTEKVSLVRRFLQDKTSLIRSTVTQQANLDVSFP